jgi:hypothetical protein
VSEIYGEHALMFCPHRHEVLVCGSDGASGWHSGRRCGGAHRHTDLDRGHNTIAPACLGITRWSFPGRAYGTKPLVYYKAKYKRPRRAGRFLNKSKQFSRIAIRREKTRVHLSGDDSHRGRHSITAGKQ